MCVMASFKEKANERKEGEEEGEEEKFPKKGELALASSTKGTPTVSLSLSRSFLSIYKQKINEPLLPLERCQNEKEKSSPSKRVTTPIEVVGQKLLFLIRLQTEEQEQLVR